MNTTDQDRITAINALADSIGRSAESIIATVSLIGTGGGGEEPAPPLQPVQPTPSLLPKPTIMIDPGHGGRDPGAVGPNGMKESEVVLAVSERLGIFLIDKVMVYTTRETDTFVELTERSKRANRVPVDLFLSIHCNSAGSSQANGYEVFTSPGETEADPFATQLFLSWAARNPDKVGRVDHDDGDPDKEANFSVLRHTRMPAALFEIGFISNSQFESYASSDVNRQFMAESLGLGILAHLGLD